MHCNIIQRDTSGLVYLATSMANLTLALLSIGRKVFFAEIFCQFHSAAKMTVERIRTTHIPKIISLPMEFDPIPLPTRNNCL